MIDIPAMNVCDVQYAVTFVKQNQASATKVAQQLNVLPEDVLGLSAAESLYGTSSIARQASNYFSLHGTEKAPFATGVRRNGDGPMSIFPSYLTSAQSFASQFGSLVTRGRLTRFLSSEISGIFGYCCGVRWPTLKHTILSDKALR